jgi:hypothetical protein
VKKRTIIGLAVAALIGASLWQVLHEEYGVGVDSVSRLPAEARNITYLRNDLIQMAEFDIERGAFEKWCTKRKTPLQELRERYHAVDRCLPILRNRGILPALDEPNTVGGDAREMEQFTKVFDAGDLFYEKRWSNGGGYSIGYDVREKRGYYRFSRH